MREATRSLRWLIVFQELLAAEQSTFQGWCGQGVNGAMHRLGQFVNSRVHR